MRVMGLLFGSAGAVPAKNLGKLPLPPCEVCYAFGQIRYGSCKFDLSSIF